jgi:hypothetical protein
MIKIYKTAFKSQIILKAAVTGMVMERKGNTLTITAREGFTFHNGQTTLRYAGDRGVWAQVYGHAYTDIMQPLISV